MTCKQCLHYEVCVKLGKPSLYGINQKAVEHYPCNHCGECPIWLAAFDVEELKTYDKVLKACIERNCELVGKVVEEEY